MRKARLFLGPQGLEASESDSIRLRNEASSSQQNWEEEAGGRGGGIFSHHPRGPEER